MTPTSPAPLWPQGVPFPTPWAEVADAVRAGTMVATTVYSWRTRKLASVEGTPFQMALSARAETASLDEVRPLLNACADQGAPLYRLHRDQKHHDDWTLLAHIRDPDKLVWWLDRGGDPCVSDHNHHPMWWAFADAGQLDLLNVLRARPLWDYWSRVRDASNTTVFHRWAWLDQPSGPAKPSSAAWAVKTLSWLTRNVPPALNPSLNPSTWFRLDPLVTFWEQALDGEPRAMTVWAMLLDLPELTPTVRTQALWDEWSSTSIHRTGPPGAVIRQMGQALEAAVLRRAIQEAPAPAPDEAPTSPLPLPRARL